MLLTPRDTSRAPRDPKSVTVGRGIASRCSSSVETRSAGRNRSTSCHTEAGMAASVSGCEESVELRTREHAGLGWAVAPAIVADIGALRIARYPCEMQLLLSHAVVAQAHWRRLSRRPMSSRRRQHVDQEVGVGAETESQIAGLHPRRGRQPRLARLGSLDGVWRLFAPPAT